MASDQTRNVSLTAELNAFTRAQVASGLYRNASEVVWTSQRQEQRDRRRRTRRAADRAHAR